MSGESSEPRVPRIQIELTLEGPVGLAVVDAEPADVERVVEWVNSDPLRRLIVAGALTLGQPNRERDVDASDEVLAAIAAALAQVRTERVAPSLEEALRAICPMGSFQSQELRWVVAQGEPGRRWLRWALQQPWKQDPDFREALHVVAEAEGLEVPDVSAEDDAPADSGEDLLDDTSEAEDGPIDAA